MRPPTVSVVVIFRDDERFLADAIDSVLAQSFQDWELILVDDGSTDGSTEIARGYAATHSDRARYVEHEGHANQGISAARNLGISQAAGTYVALLDSDDVWNPEKLEEQVAILGRHPEVGLLFGASLYWWSWAEGSTTPDQLMRIGAAEDVVHRPPLLATTLYPLGRGVAPCPSSCLAKRDVLEAVGGFEAHFRGLYEDQCLLAKAYLATPVYVSSRCWDRYRRHPGSIMQTVSRTHYHETRRQYLSWYEEYLEERGIHEPAITRALDRAQWPYRHPRLAALRTMTSRAQAKLFGWTRRSSSRKRFRS